MALSWPSKFSGRLKFRHNKTYIIPTKFGFLFGLLCLILLYSSFATGNNLMYLYTFLITGLGFTSLWLTHSNINEVEIIRSETDDVFAEDKAYSTFVIVNKGSSPRYHITVGCKNEEVVVLDEIQPNSEKSIRIPIGNFKRGKQKLPRVTLATEFPFRFLRSWKHFELEQSIYVFPKREGQSSLPSNPSNKHSNEGRTIDQFRSPEAEFSGHRKFEGSDSPRQIDWKAYARTDRLLVKDYQGFNEQIIKIQWNKTFHMKNIESRLSQMALWIEVAEMKGFHYSFELGKNQISSSRGRAHYLQCLKKLAEAESENLA